MLTEINRIDNRTQNLVDNGLFDKQKKAFEEKGIDPDRVYEDIQQELKEARTRLYDDDLSESEYFTSKARRSYNKALYTPSRRWRFSNVYAVPIWIYLVGFLGAVLAFYAYQLDSNFLELDQLDPPGVRIEEVALHAATWGTVGGLLRGLWFLKKKVSGRKYENSLRIYFLSVPFLGGLFGAMIYFILLAGFFILAPAMLDQDQTASGPNPVQTEPEVEATSGNTSLNQDQTASGPNPVQTEPEVEAAEEGGEVNTNLAIIPLAALAGYNWEWAVIIFNRIGDSFKERKEEVKEE